MIEDNFHISISGGGTLDLSQIWPDGDAPEIPTAADVAKVIGEYGPIGRWISDWHMPVEVHVDGERVEWWS